MNWIKRVIVNDDGEKVDALSPYIISASRSTDIPAFYSKWFFNRLNKGYIVWTNPFNQEQQYISFLDTRFIVFWTKNPLPIIPYLRYLLDRDIEFYFQITLNDYEKEALEPNVPQIDSRIETFITLSNQIGKAKTIWRFDPLILSNDISIDTLIERIRRIGEKIHPYTEKLVFSFVDINGYRKVSNNLYKYSCNYREFNHHEILIFSEKLVELNLNWGLQLATCAEEIQLSSLNIQKNRCIDDTLIAKLGYKDSILMSWMGLENSQSTLFSNELLPNPKLKDKGQRKSCGCIMSKDIGMYNTCNHLCAYCYANNSRRQVEQNFNNHDDNSPYIVKP